MTSQDHKLEASFVTLSMSIASSAAMSLGLVPDPANKKTAVNVELAQFNIDLLDMLKNKTQGNLLKEESDFLERVLSDLKFRFLEVKKNDRTSK